MFSVRQRHTLLKDAWVAAVDEAHDPYFVLLKEAYSRAPESGLLEQVSYGEGCTYMSDVLLRDTDQMSMAHSLEVRAPLLDHKLSGLYSFLGLAGFFGFTENLILVGKG